MRSRLASASGTAGAALRWPSMPGHPPSRRQFVRYAGASAAALRWSALGIDTAAAQPAAGTRMHTRPIPSSGEAMPVVGLGTYINFDVAPGSADYQRLPEVLRTLFAAGGTVIDSSPMYRRAEQTTGELLDAMTPRPAAFLATKVWTSGRDAGIAQMEQSFRLLRTRRIDLMQIHNLVDWRTHLPTLRRWKGEGRLRYLGITHYTSSAYADVEAVLKAETLDFAADQLRARRPRRRAAAPAAGARPRRRGDRQHAVRRRRAAAAAARAAVTGLGRRGRRDELGATGLALRPRPSGGDLRDSGHRQSALHGRERRCRRRATAHRDRAASARRRRRVTHGRRVHRRRIAPQ